MSEHSDHSEGLAHEPDMTGVLSDQDHANNMALKTPPEASDWHTMRMREKLLAHIDITFQMMCFSISEDYTTFFQRHVQKRLPRDRRIPIRAHAILVVLGSFPHSLNGSSIAKYLRTDKATVSRGLAALRQKELIVQTEDPSDGRAMVASLSEKGQELHDEYLLLWEDAASKAEMLTGTLWETEDIEEMLNCLHEIKDRAQGYASYQPGRMNRFYKGISRPDKVYHHGVDRVSAIPDHYFRFYTEFVTRDYLSCMNERAVKPLLADLSINLTELRVLMALDYYSHPLTQSEVSASLRFDSATVARSAQALEAEDLIDYVQSKADLRLRALILTQKGQALASAYRAKIKQLTDTIQFSLDTSWSTEERSRKLGILMRIRDRASAFADIKKLPTARIASLS